VTQPRILSNFDVFRHAPYGCNDAAFQIDLAESAEETEDDFSAVIPRMERLSRVDLPATERQSAAAGSR
jgi:hypothetical protein